MEREEIFEMISEGVELSKQGSASEVYGRVVPLFEGGHVSERSHYALGWIVYYALHQSANHAIRERKRMLALYLRLKVTKPHKLHSMVLTEAIRLHKDASDMAAQARLNKGPKPEDFSIVKFTGLWEPANLRPGDWKRKTVDDKELPSTAEKLLTEITDELYTGGTVPTEWIMQLARQALEQNPGSPTLCAQFSRLSELNGQKAEAIKYLRLAILGAPTKFFLWSRLAALITEAEDTRLKISLLHKATQCPGPEDFKGRIHLMLAETLAGAGAAGQALWELEQVKSLYERNGWNLPRQYRELLERIPGSIEPLNPTEAYKRISHLAEDYIFDSLPNIRVKKTYHKPAPQGPDRYGKPGQTAWRVTDSDGQNYWFQPGRFNLNADLPTGTQLEVKIHNQKIVRVKICG